MKKCKAFIWDLDGTLLDSYKSIVGCLEDICLRCGVPAAKEEILRFVIKTSVSEFLRKTAEKCGRSFEEMKSLYSDTAEGCAIPITLMPGAEEILRGVVESGHRNFVYTHKGITTKSVLTELRIISLFSDIVSSLNGFQRKPAPDGLNYLIDKWKLERSDTYYIGDRTLDMECAGNAGVHGIFYLPPNSAAEASGVESAVISDLRELQRWF